jgi:type II secretory pathway component PulF
MSDATAHDLELSLYLRYYSAMVEKGVCLVHCMVTLGEGPFSPPLVAANNQVLADVMAGSTLSAAMAKHPEYFGPFMISMVRAGEVGGVLDETLTRAAGYYERLQDNRRLLQTATALAPNAPEETRERIRQVLDGLSEIHVSQYYCYRIGIMLGSGVPIVQALQVAAEQLPERYASLTADLLQAVHGEGTLVECLQKYEFPSVLITMVGIGEETGRLDETMITAGDLLGAEAEAVLLYELDRLLPDLGIDTKGLILPVSKE